MSLPEHHDEATHAKLRSIARTLNTNHSKPVYGLGSASTIYPVSAFVTDLVYLAGTRIAVDIKRLTVSGIDASGLFSHVSDRT